MSDRWSPLRTAAESAAAARIRRRAAGLRWRQRSDGLLATILALVLAVILGLAAWLAWSAAIRPLFDPSVVGPLRDDRVLENIHDPTSADFIDALSSPWRGDSIFAREDGSAHRLDAETLLVSDIAPLPDDELTGALAQLTALCHRPGACPGGDAVLALTDSGGAAELDGAVWRVLISDLPWTGPDGTPLGQEALVSWSADAEGRWLLAATADRGVALFDLSRNAWVTPDFSPEAEALFPAAQVTEVARGGGGFAIATDVSLFTALPFGAGWRISPVEALGGEIVDLAPTPGGEDVLVILQAPCEESAGSCLSVWRGLPGEVFSRLVGEEEHHPDLGLTTLTHAAMQGDALVVLGSEGIHRYDPDNRAWRALQDTAIDAYHAGPRGERILFAAGSSAGDIRAGAITETWELEDHRLTQILPVSGGGVLGLTESGQVLDVTTGDLLTHPDPDFDPDMEILRAAAMGEVLVLIGREGAFLVDVATRRRGFIEAADLPAGLTRPGIGLAGSARGLWYWVTATGEIGFLTLAGDWPDRTLDAEPPLRLGQRLVSVMAEGGELSVTLQSGLPVRVYRSPALGWSTPVGQPLQGSAGFTSLAVMGQDLAFSDGQTVQVYSPDVRGWTDRLPLIPSERIRDIAAGQALVALTDSGRIYRFEDNGQSWTPIFGLGQPAPLASADVTDAVATGGSVLLAGDGAVMALDSDSLAVTRSWSGGRGEVRLLGLSGGQPIWLSGGVLRHGTRVLTPQGSQTLAAVAAQGAVIQQLRAGSGTGSGAGGYLRRTPLGQGSEECRFFGSPAPPGPVLGGRGLPGGQVYLQSARASHVYVPRERRWLEVQAPQGGSATQRRTFLVAGWLFDLSDGRLSGLPLADIAFPDSCAAPRLTLQWSLTRNVTDIAVDEARGRLAMLMADGRVELFEGGQVRTVLPAATSGPARGALRQVLDIAGGVALTTDDRIWSYDADDRRWNVRSISGHNTADLFAHATGDGGFLVTQWGAAGPSWGAVAPPGNASVQTRVLTQITLPPFDIAPGRLRDMAESSNRWLRLTEDELAVSNAEHTAWVSRIALPDTTDARTLSLQGGLVLITTETVSGSELAIVPGLLTGLGDTTLAAIAATYRPATDRDHALVPAARMLWRLDRTGRLLRCTIRAGRDLNGDCEEISPAPLALETASVGRAVALGTQHLVEVNGRFQWLSADMRSLTDAGLQLSPEARIFSGGVQMMAFDPEDGRLLALSPGQVAPLATGVARVLSVRRALWLEMTDGRILRLSPAGIEDRTEALIAETLSEDGQLHALDAEGRPLTDGSPDDTLLAPLPTDARALLPGQVAAGPEGGHVPGWWVQDGAGRVNFHFTGQCELPPPPPAEPPNETPPEEESEPQDSAEAPLGTEPGGDLLETPSDDPVADLPEGTEDLNPSEAAPESEPEMEPEPQPAPEPEPESEPEPAPESEPEAEPEAEPEPVFEPCPATLWPEGLPLNGRLTAVSTTQGGRIGLRADRETLLVPLTGDTPERSVADAPVLAAPDAVTDSRAAILARIEDIDGTPVLAPNRIDRDRIDVVVTAGLDRLRYSAPVATPMPALDEGWLSWDRAARRFVFDGLGGPRALSPAEAIVNARLLPDQPGRAAMLESGGFAWLTDSALWHYQPGQTGPRLVDSGEFPAPVGLSGGVFLLPSGGLSAATGAPIPDNGQVTVTLGDLTLTGTLRQPSVSATMITATSNGPAQVDALAATGFGFDRRLGLAFEGDRLLLQTALGLMPVDRLEALDRGPGNAPTTGDMVPDSTHPQLLDGDSWWARSASGGWTTIPDPLAEIEIASGAGRRWWMENGALRIDPVDPAAPWTADRTGLTFGADGLTGLAREGDTLLLLTAAATETLPRLILPGTPSNGSDPLPAGMRADSLYDASAGWVAFARGPSGTVMDWQTGWQMATTGAWQSRTAVDLPALRVTFGNGAPDLSLAARTGGGVNRWTGLTWPANQRLAQNRATAIHAMGGELLIGTEAGLRHVAGRSASTFLDLADAPAAGAPAAAITALGHPADAPDRLSATGQGGLCADLDIGTGSVTATACATATDLGQRFVVQTPLWLWQEGTGGLSAGYVIDGQVAASPPVQLRGGYWPHDRLRGFSRNCGSGTFEIWQDADVGLPGRPAQGGATALPDAFEDLFCLSGDRPLGQGQSLAEGLYLNAGSAPLRRSGSGWQPVPAPEAAALAETARGALPYVAGRYRVTLAGGAIAEQYLTLAGDWLTLDPGLGGMALDGILALGTVDGGMLLATEAGVHAPRVWPNGLGIDPETLHLWTPGTNTPALAGCAPDAVATSDGNTHGQQSEDAPALLLRCTRAGEVLTLVPDPTTDLGAVMARDGDPFDSVELVDEDGIWTWRRSRWAPGEAPELAITFRGEAMPLSGGRLGIDAYTGIAAGFEGRYDMVGVTGWWQSPTRSDLALFGQARVEGPVDPAVVSALTDDRDGETPVLCLTTPAGPVLATADGGARQVQACGQFQGRDGFWSYRDLTGAVQATGQSRNGPTLDRTLSEGRFTDLRVAGQAGLSADRAEVILPNTDGALAFDRRTGRIEGYYALPGTQGILRDDTGVPMALTSGGLRLLEGTGQPLTDSCPVLAQLGDVLTDTTMLLRLEQSPLGRLNMRLALGQALVLLEVDCADAAAVRVGSVTLDVSEALRFRGNAARWSAESALLSLTAPGLGNMELGNDAGRSLALPAGDGAEGPGPILAMTASPRGHGVYIVTPDTVLSLDRDAALEWLYSGSTTSSAPELPALGPVEVPDDHDPADPAPQDSEEPDTEESTESALQDPTDGSVTEPEAGVSGTGGGTGGTAGTGNPDDPAQEDAPVLTNDQQPVAATPETVRAIQTALFRLGLYTAGIDGIHGPMTSAAIRLYQQRIGIAADGILTNGQLARLQQDAREARK